jgi:hypothetical protein
MSDKTDKSILLKVAWPVSDSDSDDDSPLSFEPLQQELEDMLAVLNQTIDGLEKVKKEVCTPHDLFDELHLKTLLHIHLMNWKAEGRLSPSGSTVRLTEEEAKELRIAFTKEPVSIYTVCCAMVNLVLDK